MKPNYADVSSRIKAIVADSLIIVILCLIVNNIFEMFETVPNILRIMAAVLIFLLYDPLLTSIFGATIGHKLMGITVRRENDTSKNIIFPLALLRFIIKVFMGWISFLMIIFNKKNKAIHDIAVKSLVIEKGST